MRTAGRFRACEPHGDDDSPAGEIRLPDARLDERQRRAGVELEHVVRRVLEYLPHLSEQLSVLILHTQSYELEDIELVVLAELRQARACDRELGSALDLAIERDHSPSSGTAPRENDLRRFAGRVERRSGGEYPLAIARVVDEEAAVEPVRFPHAADRDEISHEASRLSLASGPSERGADSTTSTTGPSERRPTQPAARAHRGGRLCRPGAVRGRWPQSPRSVNSETASSRVAFSSAPSYGVRRCT